MLWMHLYDLAKLKIITVECGDHGLYGLTQFTVLAASIEEFNSGRFPTLLHLQNKRSLCTLGSTEYKNVVNEQKRIKKCWNTAGFVQSEYTNGAVIFRYSSEIRQKAMKSAASHKAPGKAPGGDG
jgi:hypothetical protein